MILKFLGRGSAFNVEEGNTSAYIKEDNKLLLIDCGENIFERILKKKILDNVNEIHILITHLHGDHIGSLSSLIYYCYFMKHIKPKVYFPNTDLYFFLKLQGHKEHVEYDFIEMQEDTCCGICRVSPFSARHKNGIDAFSYLLFIKDNIIWYSGDTNDLKYLLECVTLDYDEIYQDTCLLNYENNPHVSIKKLCDGIPIEMRHKIYCMHLDSNELISLVKENGFNVVDIE
jgi:phosphoribosyl 1,2-cyclic phosphodiesterase